MPWNFNGSFRFEAFLLHEGDHLREKSLRESVRHWITTHDLLTKVFAKRLVCVRSSPPAGWNTKKNDNSASAQKIVGNKDICFLDAHIRTLPVNVSACILSSSSVKNTIMSMKSRMSPNVFAMRAMSLGKVEHIAAS